MNILGNELMFLTSHNVRKPLSSCIGLIDLIKASGELRSNEIEVMLDHLKISMMELDEQTKRLTLLLYHQDQKSRLFKKADFLKEYFSAPPAGL